LGGGDFLGGAARAPAVRSSFGGMRVAQSAPRSSGIIVIEAAGSGKPSSRSKPAPSPAPVAPAAPV
ncbi:MAG: hypothetical protein JWO33_1165, partial [Caulobacteraceae bacterium]|nr:hypothetical protein [Caulobacteraceae bacterium]